jgi:NAD(P)-dependent dehydrogenase (short-subunit alcohol dehydrogenase family)
MTLIMPSQRSGRVKKPVRALVTGGAIRLGRGIALALGAAGMDVAIGYYHSTSEARRTLAALEALDVRGIAIRADLRDAAAARGLVERAATALGGLDVLVNNAAVFHRTPFLTTTPAAYDELLDLNLRAPFFCAQAAAGVMGRGGGHIVNLGDVASDRLLPGHIPYLLAKVGIAALTRSLAAALRSRRIAVNCVAPGAVLRPPGFPEARWRALTRGRTTSVDDVARAVRFFATCPRSITGQTLCVDGRRKG